MQTSKSEETLRHGLRDDTSACATNFYIGHNPYMAEADWDVPRTEEGLQQVLRRLEECRTANDEIEIGNGLMALSHLVVWVRSDIPQEPFVRSRELVLQAVDAFRSANYPKGLIRALAAAAPMSDPQTRESMLAEAESLAEGEGDENYIAIALAAKARGMALLDREGAAVLNRRALEIYRRTGNKNEQARTLFSLAIASGTDSEKRDFAIEGANLYRALGKSDMASKCMSIAIMNALRLQPLTELEDLAREGLQDALNSGKRMMEGLFYGRLADILAAKGQDDEADKYRRWAAEIEDSDGLTPLQRWKNDIDMTKTMIAMLKAQGNKESETEFRNELKRLKSSKPKS